MKINKQEFVSLLTPLQEQIDVDNAFAKVASDYFVCNVHNNCNLDLIKAVVKFLDGQTGCCRYVEYWVFNTDFGRKNNRYILNAPLTEMDLELEPIKTNEELYDYILTQQK